MDTLHDWAVEPIAAAPVNLDDIEAVEMSTTTTKRDLQNLLLADMLCFHPECCDEFDDGVPNAGSGV